MGPFYANAGPARGPLMDRDVPGAIGVLEAPDRLMPVGMALPVGWGAGGVALWRLTLRGVDLPGRWFLVDRRFEPAKD
jgi:hypothetical protein